MCTYAHFKGLFSYAYVEMLSVIAFEYKNLLFLLLE